METRGLVGFGEWKKLQIMEQEGKKRLFVKGQAYMIWGIGDEIAERMAMVQLYELGLGTQEELAETFQVHVNTVSKYVSRFEEGGIRGLKDELRGPKEKWKIVPEVRAKILMTVLKEGVRDYTEIQKSLEERWAEKISVRSIRQILLENGFVEERVRSEVKQEELFKEAENGQPELH